jgi:hypothetical protein
MTRDYATTTVIILCLVSMLFFGAMQLLGYASFACSDWPITFPQNLANKIPHLDYHLP